MVNSIFKELRSKAHPFMDRYFLNRCSEVAIENVLASSDEGRGLLKLFYDSMDLCFKVRLTKFETSGLYCKSLYPAYIEVREEGGDSRTVVIEHRIKYGSEAPVSYVCGALGFAKLIELGFPGIKLENQRNVGEAFGWIATFVGSPYFTPRINGEIPVYPVLEVSGPGEGELTLRLSEDYRTPMDFHIMNDIIYGYPYLDFWESYRIISEFYIDLLIHTISFEKPEVYGKWALFHYVKVLTLLFPEVWDPNKPEMVSLLAADEVLHNLGRRDDVLPGDIKDLLEPLKNEGPKPLMEHSRRPLTPTYKTIFEMLTKLPFKSDILNYGFTEDHLTQIGHAYAAICKYFTGIQPNVRWMWDFVAFKGESRLEGEPELIFE